MTGETPSFSASRRFLRTGVILTAPSLDVFPPKRGALPVTSRSEVVGGSRIPIESAFWSLVDMMSVGVTVAKRSVVPVSLPREVNLQLPVAVPYSSNCRYPEQNLKDLPAVRASRSSPKYVSPRRMVLWTSRWSASFVCCCPWQSRTVPAGSEVLRPKAILLRSKIAVHPRRVHRDVGNKLNSLPVTCQRPSENPQFGVYETQGALPTSRSPPSRGAARESRDTCATGLSQTLSRSLNGRALIKEFVIASPVTSRVRLSVHLTSLMRGFKAGEIRDSKRTLLLESISSLNATPTRGDGEATGKDQHCGLATREHIVTPLLPRAPFRFWLIRLSF